MISIYTDGGVMHNGEPHAYGSWAFVCYQAGLLIAECGLVEPDSARRVTNNRTELLGVIHALEWAEGVECEIATDSQMTQLCALGRWKRRVNLDLWERYDEAQARTMLLGIRWVRGHGKDEMNNRADQLCTAVMRDYAATGRTTPSRTVERVAVAAPAPAVRPESLAPWEGPDELAPHRYQPPGY